MLGLSAKDKISCDFLCDVMEGAQKNNDVELEVTCFFLIAFNVLLMPSTDMYLSAPQMQAAMNLEKIRQINWRKEILYHLAKGVKARKSSKTETTDNIYGPVTVLLLFYLDHLKKTELQADVLVTPRICYYNSAMVSDLVNDTTDISGKDFQKLELGDATLYSLNYNECDKVKPPKTNKDIMQCRRRVNQEKDGGIKKTKGGKNTLNTSVRIPALVDFINCHLKDIPRYLHNDAIKTVKEKHSSMMKLYEQILDIESDTSSTISNLLDRYSYLDEFYSSHILSKEKWEEKDFEQKYVVDLYGIRISEYLFVQSMKPTGWLSNFIIDVVCAIWREEEEWRDKIILSQPAVRELLARSIGEFVKKELSDLDKKQIFVPVLSKDENGNGEHWSLLVVDIGKGKNYILDSLSSQCPRMEMTSVLSTLKVHFAATTLNNFSSFETEKPELSEQINGNDCGIHMLLYMEGFGRKKIDDFSPEDVQMYRKKLVKDLYDNLHNKPHDMEFMSPTSTWTDDNGFVRLQDTTRAGRS
ncbi:unnamed protein product [Urochloa decumbens]|uniref:Ubiquitin-like protease family profile domain-containing protein n=1 Tax=Urochloa decumbens TaxID=240449 RepID=A0ABC9H537_9POAL